MVQVIVLGGGCFWCTEAVFQKIKGVTKVESGYAGGEAANPTYEQVSTGETGHAECVRVEYDADQVGLNKILDVFFAVHDPTTLNRQGNDVGTQYRSIIFWTEPEQEKAIKDYLIKVQDEFKDPVVTEVEKLDMFYPAEDYHEDYYNQNKSKMYCRLVISPKLKKVEEKFADWQK
ncbi:peptide-methionine (S)-S-oxide reductase MsrA [Patescibacteria group bacterium]|nr:peptide-methionine (S)-S-oxide reductase MsrA [Patescibacteria group bacterium]MBU1705198.1 peptide-methionine (S)-S-oxide reductase MsrA [Patescibacteria group bacterium]